MDFHEAAKVGNTKDLNVILDDEAFDIDCKNADGCTALHLAAMHGQAAAGSLLVESDADITVTDPRGNTPLHMASIHNERLVTSMLLWAGSDCEAKNDAGNTPFHEAAANGAKDCLFLILDRQGDVVRDLKNNAGKTALDLAKEQVAAKKGEAYGKIVQMIETGEHID